MALGAELKTVELYLQKTKKILESLILNDCTADLKLSIFDPSIKQRQVGSDFENHLLRELEDISPIPHPFSMFRTGKRKSEPPEPSHEFEIQLKAEMLIAFLSHLYKRFEIRKKEIEEAIKNETTPTT